jgi:hypothetical protein
MLSPIGDSDSTTELRGLRVGLGGGEPSGARVELRGETSGARIFAGAGRLAAVGSFAGAGRLAAVGSFAGAGRLAAVGCFAGAAAGLLAALLTGFFSVTILILRCLAFLVSYRSGLRSLGNG